MSEVVQNYSDEHVDRLVERAIEAELLGVGFALSLGLARIRRAYNGIGPESLPAVRSWATDALALFEPAAMVHDCRFEVSDGTRLSFNFANAEFRLNCLALADREYPWWNWRRYRARAAANALYDFCTSDAGWRAWRAAHEKTKGTEQ